MLLNSIIGHNVLNLHVVKEVQNETNPQKETNVGHKYMLVLRCQKATMNKMFVPLQYYPHSDAAVRSLSQQHMHLRNDREPWHSTRTAQGVLPIIRIHRQRSTSVTLFLPRPGPFFV